MIIKVKKWIRSLRTAHQRPKRRPPASHWLPEGNQWPAHAVPMVVLIVDLIDITDKVLTLLGKR